MDEIVRALARWHEASRGVRGGADPEPYQRVQDRLRALELEQRLAAREAEPRAVQRELALQGEAGGSASGRFRVRNGSARPVRLAMRAPGARVPVTTEHPPELAPRESAECRVSVDLSGAVRPGRIELPLEVDGDGAFRMRVWITVEIA